MKTWEAKVLQAPGAPERVATIEHELRLAAGLTALREQAGLSQRALAKLIGISQPRIAAIERSRNVTVEVLEQYARAVGGRLEVSVVKGQRKVSLLPAPSEQTRAARRSPANTAVGARSRAAREGMAAKPGRGSSTAAVAAKDRAGGRSGAKRDPASARSSKHVGPVRPARAPSKAPSIVGTSS